MQYERLTTFYLISAMIWMLVFASYYDLSAIGYSGAGVLILVGLLFHWRGKRRKV